LRREHLAGESKGVLDRFADGFPRTEGSGECGDGGRVGEGGGTCGGCGGC